MIQLALIVGSITTALFVFNAVLSFREQGWTWATQVRLAAVFFPVAFTLLAIRVILLVGE